MLNDFHHVSPCFTMFHHVSPCFTMFHHVSPFPTSCHSRPGALLGWHATLLGRVPRFLDGRRISGSGAIEHVRLDGYVWHQWINQIGCVFRVFNHQQPSICNYIRNVYIYIYTHYVYIMTLRRSHVTRITEQI
jgi:hypothetical protein